MLPKCSFLTPRKLTKGVTVLYRSTVASDPGIRKFMVSGRTKKTKYVPPALYGGRHLVTMLPGHGIGPELMVHIRDIFSSMHAPLDFEILDTIKTQQNVKDAITSIRRNGCCIKGNIDVSDKLKHFRDLLLSSPNVAIRKKLDLFANINIIKSYKNIISKYNDLDIVVIRQNTEGEYAMMEHENKPGIVESMKVCTRYNSERIANWAVKWVKLHNRKKVTIVHKANIMKLSDGLFMKTVKDVMKHHPEIEVNDIIIDNCCMQMVSNPSQFDVLICPNLYGTILCNVICGLIGGAGLISGSNYGDNYATFETASRSTGTPLAGRNLANPIALLNASIDLLFYLGLDSHGQALAEAIRMTTEVDGISTEDVGGKATTSEVIERIIVNIGGQIK